MNHLLTLLGLSVKNLKKFAGGIIFTLKPLFLLSAKGLLLKFFLSVLIKSINCKKQNFDVSNLFHEFFQKTYSNQWNLNCLKRLKKF